MRMHGMLLIFAAALCSGCFDNPTAEYAQRIIGSWRMATPVMGKPAEGMLHIMPEGNYILDNGNSARVAKLLPSGEGRWSVLRDELELLAMQASPLSHAGLRTTPASLHIVALDQQRLVTADPEFGVKVEWVRVSPLN